MFRHRGKTRTAKHNLQIASLLSFVAGIVNVSGFLAVQKLTTNVTGHFAFFVEQVFQLHYWIGFLYFLYIFFFFLGAFVSGFLVEWVARKNENTTYMLPLFIEIVLLLLVVILGDNLIENYANIIACTLLFGMGLQNALVTKISNAVVRTTHLTGLFTDLGIELAQLFFYKQPDLRQKLFSSIQLRGTIISCFFVGGIVSGLFYSKMQLKVLIIAVAVLIFGLIYDYLKLKIIQLNRHIHFN
jgi:uncharacterized membrane protein YoaK (UPF0700 family)